MPTTTASRRSTLLAIAALAIALPLALDVAPGHGASLAIPHQARGAKSAMVAVRSRLGHGCPAPPSYGWPVLPFHRQHAVRGVFGDPRIGLAPDGVTMTHQFHNGVDVVAADGTAVYATLTGRVVVDAAHPDVVWVSDGVGTTFSYWHVVPSVRSGERAIAYATIVGHVEAPWGHVHFSDIRNGVYVNPLRAGGMGPYVDRTPPDISTVTLEHRTRAVPLARAHGSLDVIAQIDDEPAQPIAAPWHDLPVMPVALRWRVSGPHGAGTRWATAVDFTRTIPGAPLFSSVYAQWTRQNHPNHRGRYRVFLTHDWATSRLPNGRYRIDVETSDLCGNRSRASAWISIDNRLS
jgi:hypothetical protein